MTSEKQVAANRRNAAKSTGPRTDAGKAIARRNAIKHGLCADRLVMEGEDAQEFEDLRKRLADEITPADVIEGQLVNRIAISLWRLNRAAEIEAALFTYLRRSRQYELASNEMTELYGKETGLDFDLMPINPSKTLEAAQKRLEEASQGLEDARSILGRLFTDGEKSLMTLQRYDAAAERALYRALRELHHYRAASGRWEADAEQPSEPIPLPAA